MLKRSFFLLSLGACGTAPSDKATTLESERSAEDAFIENSFLRIGVNKSAGAAINFLALTSDKKNLINAFDEGRFIQSSFYGDGGEGVWGNQPWPWNPVQGGGYKRGVWRSRVTSFRNDGNSLYSEVRPRDWSTGKEPNVKLTQKIQLIDDYVKVEVTFQNNDRNNSQLSHQEVPAVFVDAAFSRLVSFTKPQARAWTNAPWDSIQTSSASRPQGQHTPITEGWAAYVNEKNFGIGVMNPKTWGLAHYRVVGTEDKSYPSKTGPQSPNTSYLALTTTQKIPKGFKETYKYFIKIGTLESIRKTFNQIKRRE